MLRQPDDDSPNWVIRAVAILALATGLLWSVVFAARCSAQCAPEVEHRSEELSLEGDDGVWFHERVAACLLHDVEELHLQRERVSLMQERLTLRDEQYALLQEAATQGTQALEDGQSVIDTTVARAVSAEADRDVWQWLGLLWGGVGAAIGAAVVLLIGLAI